MSDDRFSVEHRDGAIVARLEEADLGTLLLTMHHDEHPWIDVNVVLTPAQVEALATLLDRWRKE